MGICFEVGVLQQTAWMVVSPVAVWSFSILFDAIGLDCRLCDDSHLETYLYIRWLGPGALAFLGPPGVAY